MPIATSRQEVKTSIELNNDCPTLQITKNEAEIGRNEVEIGTRACSYWYFFNLFSK